MNPVGLTNEAPGLSVAATLPSALSPHHFKT